MHCRCGQETNGLLWLGEQYLCWVHYWYDTAHLRVANQTDYVFRRND